MKKRGYKKIAIIIFLILIISITTGYAILEEKIKITGKVNLKTGENEDLEKYIVTYSIENKWYTNGLFYYNIKINILNNTNETLDGWKVSIMAPQNPKLEGYYNVNSTIKNGNIIFENVEYNSQILSKQSVSFSFIIATEEENYKPSNITINGSETIKPEEPDKPEEKMAEVKIDRMSGWQAGDEYFYQYTITIKNTSSVQINSWQFDIDLKNDSSLEQAWNANYTQTGTTITFKNSDYNGIISVNNSASFGIMLKTKQENKELIASNIILK